MPKSDPPELQGDEIDDHTLEMAAHNDEFAWRRIVRRVHRRVVVLLGQASQNAEDVTQTVCMNIMHALKAHKFRKLDEGGAQAWVIKIATNAAIDQARRDKRTAMVASSLSPDDEISELVEQPQRELDKLMSIDEALFSLSNAHRVALVLYYVDRLTYKEIAERLDVPENTVKSRVNRALAKLRASLREGEDFDAELRGVVS